MNKRADRSAPAGSSRSPAVGFGASYRGCAREARCPPTVRFFLRLFCLFDAATPQEVLGHIKKENAYTAEKMQHLEGLREDLYKVRRNPEMCRWMMDSPCKSGAISSSLLMSESLPQYSAKDGRTLQVGCGFKQLIRNNLPQRSVSVKWVESMGMTPLTWNTGCGRCQRWSPCVYEESNTDIPTTPDPSPTLALTEPPLPTMKPPIFFGHPIQEFLGHMKETDTEVPYRHGPYFYYSRSVKGKPYRIHCRSREQGGEEQVRYPVGMQASGPETRRRRECFIFFS